MQSKAKYNLALFNPKSRNFGWGREMCENRDQTSKRSEKRNIN